MKSLQSTLYRFYENDSVKISQVGAGNQRKVTYLKVSQKKKQKG